MPFSDKVKRAPPPSHGGKQQRIPAMLGDRVTKPRTFADGTPPVLKKQKLDLTQAIQAPVAQKPIPPVDVSLQSQKRKWRLAEIVRKDREARRQKSQETPSFVFEMPHMDTRRPRHAATQSGLPPKASVGAVKAPKEKPQRDSTNSYSRIVYNAAADAPGTRSHGSLTVPGGEAILYSRSMLPESHLMLLDVLIALESAVSLLKTRRTLPTFSAVRDIVRSSTRREFTIKVLSQLAHVIPEAIAVLPGGNIKSTSKRRSDGFLIRLDDVDPKRIGGDEKNVVRLRRSLLHKRLLQHVRECHQRFLNKSSIKRHDSEMWHPEFDLETEVEELPAPPLYPEEVPTKPETAAMPLGPANKVTRELPTNRKDDLPTGSDSPHASDDDDCVPSNLLEKVRARFQARKAHEVRAEMEKSTNRSLLSKLPCTMDTICSLLRAERRSAMGWSQLLSKVEKAHPKKWPKDDLEKQLHAITDLGGEWCAKVELKSLRGGFAFRIVSDANFGQARVKVSCTTSYTVADQ